MNLPQYARAIEMAAKAYDEACSEARDRFYKARSQWPGRSSSTTRMRSRPWTATPCTRASGEEVTGDRRDLPVRALRPTLGVRGPPGPGDPWHPHPAPGTRIPGRGGQRAARSVSSRAARTTWRTAATVPLRKWPPGRDGLAGGRPRAALPGALDWASPTRQSLTDHDRTERRWRG